MTVQKGDVVLARVPHTAGTRGKKRPAVVIQADAYNTTLWHVVVAEVTYGRVHPPCFPSTAVGGAGRKI